MDDDEVADTVVRRDRFSGGPARSFLSSMAEDERIFEADLAVDRAHVVMLAEQEIVEADDAAAIFGALDSIEEAGYGALPDGEDVHEAIETAVIERIGEVGGKMHTARSRNDEVATCIRYRLREDLLEVLEAVLEFREALSAVAAEHAETVMPGYTHLQPAQPTTVAHYILSYEQAATRDTARLHAAFDRTNRSPLGSAAFAGTPFDVDRTRTAELLGFPDVLENSMDAVTTRDFLLETAGALAGLSVTLSGLAEDLIGFSKDGLVALDDAYASTSSIMPQKKNPDSLELVRATAGDSAASFQGLLTTVSGLPRAYNRDLQKATPHVWDAIDELAEATRVAAGAVATADWNEAALVDAAAEGFSTATGVADRLAMAGLPFRTAHEIVAEAAEALDATAEGTDAARATDPDAALEAIRAATRSVTGEDLASFAPVEEVAALLDPAASVAARDSFGGPAPEVVEAALSRDEATIQTDREAVADLEAAVEAATAERQEVVDGYV